MKTLKQQAKTPKQIWIINSEINIENSLWINIEDIKEWLQEHYPKDLVKDLKQAVLIDELIEELEK